MRIVVLGAGTVGGSIAAELCQHRHSVTLVDVDGDHVRELNDTLDVRCITGSASQSSVLFQAGVNSADLCLAVTGDDEVNIVAASMSKAMGARRSVARVYAPVFRDLSTFDYQRHFGIDRLLSLEHLTAMELARGINHPGSVAVESLARGQLEVHEVFVDKNKRVSNKPLKELKLSNNVRIGSIQRGGKTWIAGAEDQIELGDQLTVVGNRAEIDRVKAMLCTERPTRQRVVIAGGGETGYHLAAALEGQRFSVVLIDHDRQRCEFLAKHLEETVVVNLDATRRAHLEEERIGSADVFVACLGDDEDNIMASVEARDLGAKLIMALVGRPDYAHVVGRLGIDRVVSPRGVVARQILEFLSRGPIISRTPLSDGSDLSVVEIDVSPDSSAIHKALAQLHLPLQCLVVARIREGFVAMPKPDSCFQSGDTVIALVADSVIDDVERAFASG